MWFVIVVLPDHTRLLFLRIIGKPDFSNHFIKLSRVNKRVGYNLDIMPGFKPNHGLKLCFPLQLHDNGTGLRHNHYDGSDVKF